MQSKQIIQLVAMLLIGLLIGVAMMYFAFPPASTTTTAVKYTFGCPLELSGGFATQGLQAKAGMEIALDEINAWLKSCNSNVTFDVIVLDTASSATQCLSVVQTLVETHNTQVLIGPDLSSSCAAIKSYIDNRKIATFCQSSSPALKFKDYLFRVWAPDDRQSTGLTEILWGSGVRKVAVISRADTWGDSLREVFETQWKSKGGTVESVKATPDLPDYGSEVSALHTKVESMGAGPTTAVLSILLEAEALNIFGHARQDTLLSSVEWYGAELGGSDAVIPPRAPVEIGNWLAHTVNMTGTLAATMSSPTYSQFEQKFINKTGVKPLVNGVFQYDFTWLAALSVLDAGQWNGEAVAKAVLPASARFIGASGALMLDENGDRALQDYTILAVKESGGSYSFTAIGLYDFINNKLIWY
jgi:branched-chain amino acid transport system substrate-binding protein